MKQELISLHHYDVTREEFEEWVYESGADVYAINSSDPKLDSSYWFENPEDLVIFELRFRRK